MSGIIYHSALHVDLTGFEELDYYENNGMVALQNDICNGLPAEFDKCDVIYAEPAWPKGLGIFNKRAGISTEWEGYFNSIVNICNTEKRPLVICWGSRESKLLPKPSQSFKSKLAHGSDVYINIYNYTYDGPQANTMNVLFHLAEVFNCIGDFCCGYGNSAIPFLVKGKKFVMADYNSRCIGYIAEKLIGQSDEDILKG
jgi:hypothetical protein